jgi:hypothetical protein
MFENKKGRKVMKRLILWMTALLFMTATALPSGATSVYLLYNQWGGTWQDANKTVANTEDDLMCWAAAASNVLAWGRWGTPTYNTSCSIFTQFQDHWTDNVGFASWAWKWWLNGSPPPYNSYAYIDVPGGGNFFPDQDYTTYYTSAMGGNLMANIAAWMNQGYGVILEVDKGGTFTHSITCWGYSYANEAGSIMYKSIYVTDSDDGKTALVEYPLTWQNDMWYLGGDYTGWDILKARGFLEYSDGNEGPLTHTPIGPTWLLFSSGLLGLALHRWRSRRRKSTTAA